MLLSKVERRAYARLPIDCKVAYMRVGESRLSYGAGRNLSGNGILFSTLEAIPIGTELEINVLPSLTHLSPLNAVVEVVRLEPDASDTRQFGICGRIQQILS